MNTVIVGGGKACREIIELATGTFLRELKPEIRCVMDPDPDAPGIRYARKLGIMTTSSMRKAFSLPDLELIIELTGKDEVLEQVQKNRPPGVKLVDHTFARIFWDLVNAQTDQNRRIEEMARMEETIDAERHFLKGLLDNIPELLVVLDRNKIVVRTNASFVRFVGIDPKEAIGKTCPELFKGTPLEEQCIRDFEILNDALEKGDSFTSIWTTPPPDETHWEVTRTPIHSAEGIPEAILVTWHRIERIRLRREIETAEERFRSFINSAHDWISMKDLEGRYIIINPVTAAAFHRRPEDFIGKKVDEVLPSKLAHLIMKHDQEVIDCDCHKTYEEVIPIDGRDHYFQTVRFPLKDYKGSIMGVCTIMRDNTSEKELQNQLVQSSKLVAIGQLAAGVAHEINNPLTGILAYAEDLSESLPDNDEHSEDVDVIIRETKRCRDIVRNLLDFARQEAPKLEIMDPNAIIDQALALVQKLPQFRNIEMQIAKTENIPSIRCDQRQIQQVLLNLMLNAADAMHGKGRIILASEYERRSDRCVISVEDNGPGIPENLIDKIFEPFFSTKGTNGLGLAVSWGIVERHRGTIEVDMADEGGAIFRMLLPAYRTPEGSKG